MPTLDPRSLLPFSRDLLVARGMRAEHAQAVADALQWADLRGVPSHGIAFLPRYLQMVEDGDLALDAQPQQTGHAPGPLIVDGMQCAGAVVMREAMDVALRQAREAGTALVWVRGMTHAGAMGQYVQAAAQEGCIAMLFVAGPPLMAYHGAAQASATTGPIAMAVPGPGGQPIVFDMAVSEVSFAVLRRARELRQPLPAGAAMDAKGAVTTDPAQAVTPLPLAGAKGSGLALMFELMTSVLLGNPLVSSHLNGQRRHSQNALVMLARVDAFPDGADYVAQVAALREGLVGLPLAQGAKEIRLPGERREGVTAGVGAAGVAISETAWKELRELAVRLSVPAPAPLTPP
jgi:ureidoglycolate dehydrogenase (NAD+)